MKSNSSKAGLMNIRASNVRNKRNEIIHGIPSVRGSSTNSYNPIGKDSNKPTWWG